MQLSCTACRSASRRLYGLYFENRALKLRLPNGGCLQMLKKLFRFRSGWWAGFPIPRSLFKSQRRCRIAYRDRGRTLPIFLQARSLTMSRLLWIVSLVATPSKYHLATSPTLLLSRASAWTSQFGHRNGNGCGRGRPQDSRSLTPRNKDRFLGTPISHPKKQRPLLGDPDLSPQETKTVSWGPRSGDRRHHTRKACRNSRYLSG
jgi:hypothetical protein